jgi:hypothetical protein
MRRKLLQSLAILGLALPSIAAKSQAIEAGDSRLIGTWRSDREMTMKYRKFDDNVSPETRERFAQIFGKLTWRFTASEFFYANGDLQFSEPYRVVDKDYHSVVVSLQGHDAARLLYVQFEGDYIISAAGHSVEYFKRVDA